ncbi:MAG TPA: surface-adhesin E family protein [Caulobacteraceae bacterium]|nr:surface-adhesin E family protein [Caulobacteraceae bacterium]
MVKAAVLFAGLMCAAPIVYAQAPAAPPPPTRPVAAAPPPWKSIYENSQTVFYIDASKVQQTGPSDIAVLTEYKVPQVIDGVQIWSIVSHMKVRCDATLLATIDNTPHALQMGAGRAVPVQAGQDTWHQPEPGSLGELIWNAVCGKK